jgi:predicted transcriptional regulator
MSRNDGPKTVFGRYITLLFRVLTTHQAEVAREAHMSASTISKAMTTTKRVEEETVQRIWQGFVVIAERKGMARLFDSSLQESFFNAAHCTTDHQVSLSEQRLESLTQVFEAGRERRSSSGQN